MSEAYVMMNETEFRRWLLTGDLHREAWRAWQSALAAGSDHTAPLRARIKALDSAQGARVPEGEAIQQIKNRLDIRLNNRLCEMKEGWDDSIVGFNDAWDIMRAVFAAAPPAPSAPSRELMTVADEMVERAARTLAISDGSDPDSLSVHPGTKESGPTWKVYFAADARAALHSALGQDALYDAPPEGKPQTIWRCRDCGRPFSTEAEALNCALGYGATP